MWHSFKQYTRDLTDKQWAALRVWLPLNRKGRGRPIAITMRSAVNGRLYIAKTGCQWANLPYGFPKWQRVYYHFRKGCVEGRWERVNRILGWLAGHEKGRCPYPSGGVMDSQSVKTTAVGGGERGYDGGKKVKGRKRHILVDTQGHVLRVRVHSADIQDRDGANRLLWGLPAMFNRRLQKIWAESLYKAGIVEWGREFLQILWVVGHPVPLVPGCVRLPRRWVVERTCAWLGNYRRLSKDDEESPRSAEGFIYLAFIHVLLRRAAS